MSLSCNCPRDLKVPREELKFLFDQRHSRSTFIAGVNKETTNKLQIHPKRKSNEQLRTLKCKQKSSANASLSQHSSNTSEDVRRTKCDDELYINEYFATCSATTKSQLRQTLPNLAKEAYRNGVLDRAAALLATAVLDDFGLITKEDQSLVIEKNKLHRERSKFRKNLRIEKCHQNEAITNIYFDGRKVKTLTRTRQKEIWCGDIILEEHYVLVVEPSSAYLTHTTPISGKAIDRASSIFQFITGQGATDTIYAIGCDNANTNTGCLGGVIRQVELTLRRPLCWFIYILHTT